MAKNRKQMAFAKKLKEMRLEAGLSVYALAQMCGISSQALGKLEHGDNQPSWDTVQKISAALGVSCEVFRQEN